MRRFRKIVSSIILMLLFTLAIVPNIQAASNYHINKNGAKVTNGAQYASYTIVDIYDNNGYGVAHIVGAKYGVGEWKSRTGTGSVNVTSGLVASSSFHAYHSYGLGTNYNNLFDYQWTQDN